jgi:cyclase
MGGRKINFLEGLMAEPSVYGSKHFTLQQVTEHIFAAIAIDGGAAISNSGLVNLGGQILVFDTFLTPQAAMDLRLAALEILGRAPDVVINSHFHNDHIWGNQVFSPEAQIIASSRTRELITTEGVQELEWYTAKSAERLAFLEDQFQNTSDETERSQQLMWLGYYRGLVEALPTLSVCLPNMTFADRLEIYGTSLHAEVMTFEGGHTGSDAVLYLPEAHVVFMSDLLFVGFHPYLADGDPLQLLKALNELSQLNATCFIPGHGPVGSIEDLKLLVDYIEYCMETAQELVKDGGSNQDRIAEMPVAEQFQHWRLPQFFQANLNFLCQRMEKGA